MIMPLLQCPSCWADPWCYDCVGVIALGVYWLTAISVLVLIVRREIKKMN